MARELLAQARILAVILWTILLVDLTGASGVGRVSGQLVGTDFIQFYTLASIAAEGHLERAVSFPALCAEQLRLVPASTASVYPPVYPPQVALFLRPLASFDYRTAYLVWMTASLLLYAISIWLLVADRPPFAPWTGTVSWIAAACPALWFVALHGQLSVVALLAMTLACRALGARRPFAAGAALGILAFKPSLFVPAVLVLAGAGEWAMLGGAAVTAAAQFATLAIVGDASLISSYIATTLELLRAPDQVASKPVLMHSLRTFWTRLLPGAAALAAYAVTATMVGVAAAQAFRRLTDPLARIAVLGAAVVLISPHLFVYDLVVLVPLVIASAQVLLTRAAPVPRLKGLTYAGFLAPVWGVAATALGVQASTLIVAAWMLVFTRTAGCANDAMRRSPP